MGSCIYGGGGREFTITTATIQAKHASMILLFTLWHVLATICNLALLSCRVVTVKEVQMHYVGGRQQCYTDESAAPAVKSGVT